jgi:autotransporter-associated beta strand protein
VTNAISVAPGAVLAVRAGGAAGFTSGEIDSLLDDVAWADSTADLGIDTTNGNFAYASDITQALGLTKLGDNTLILTGSNTYSGGTTVIAGTLDVASYAALPDGSSLTVGAGAALNFDSSPDSAPSYTAPSHSASPPTVAAAVPEPGTMALLSVAGIVAAAGIWRSRKKDRNGGPFRAPDLSPLGLGPQQNVSGTLFVPMAGGTRSVPDTLPIPRSKVPSVCSDRF